MAKTAVDYVVGERVEGDVNGEWFPAVIERVLHSGEAFDIRWVDGKQWDERVSRYERQHIRKLDATGDAVEFAIGDLVLARGVGGNWWPGEVVRLNRMSLQVRWHEGSEVDTISRQYVVPLSLEEPIEHRFHEGDKIIAHFSNEGWFPCQITALMPDGYRVFWLEDEYEDRILESDAATLDDEFRGDFRAGTEVLARDEYGWWPARIRGTFGKQVEVTWLPRRGGVKGGATVDRDQIRSPLGRRDMTDPAWILAALKESTRPRPSHGANATTVEVRPSVADVDKVSPRLKYFETYCKQRLASGGIADGTHDNAYCPYCRKEHLRNWIDDINYKNKFYICQIDEDRLACITSGSARPGLRAVDLEEYMTEFPVLPQRAGGWFTRSLRSVAETCEFEIGGFPPTISLRMRRND